jgi:hypothetical protein
MQMGAEPCGQSIAGDFRTLRPQWGVAQETSKEGRRSWQTPVIPSSGLMEPKFHNLKEDPLAQSPRHVISFDRRMYPAPIKLPSQREIRIIKKRA